MPRGSRGSADTWRTSPAFICSAMPTTASASPTACASPKKPRCAFSVDTLPRRPKARRLQRWLFDGEDVVDPAVLGLVDLVAGLDEERRFAEPFEGNRYL